MTPNDLELSGERGGKADERVRCSDVLGDACRGKFAAMAEVREVLDEALKLGPDDRASVAAKLLESLEAAPEAAEAAWATEIERRARRVLSGESSGTPWDEVRRGVEANLTKR